MAVRIDATSGSDTANSYVTLAEARAYHESQLHNDDWFQHTQETLAAALIHATRLIDTSSFKGQPSSAAQALEFPRRRITVKGRILDDVLPLDIKEATAQLALDYLRNDIGGRSSVTDTTVQGQLQELQLGSGFKVKYTGEGATIRSSSGGTFTKLVLRMIRPYFGSGGGHRLVRV